MSEPEALRNEVALACRILARAGLLEGILGHVSARVDEETMVIRCRGPHERGLLFTVPSDIRRVPIGPLDPELSDGYSAPKELAIHVALYEARPEIAAVVHAHPRASLLCGLAGLPLRPVFGAYNIPAARLALDGVPTFERSALITRPDLAGELLAAMGDAPVCLMRGHGITVTGESVTQAVVRALDLDALASVTLELARIGARPPELTPEDAAELPDLGSAFNDGFVFAYHAAVDRTSR
jgi:ribulose-5-phosphate 4-epimerase/fuculose-1-phosphate aldolase